MPSPPKMSTSWRAFLGGGAPAAAAQLEAAKAADQGCDLGSSSSRARQHSWSGSVDTAAEHDAAASTSTGTGSPPARRLSESAAAFVRSVDRPFLFYH